MKWRVLVWLAVITAIYAKAGLAVDAAVAGVGQTARPQEAPRLQETRMDVLRGARGIQIRDGSAQQNYLR